MRGMGLKRNDKITKAEHLELRKQILENQEVRNMIKVVLENHQDGAYGEN